MWSCWRVKLHGLTATKSLTNAQVFVPITAVAKKVGSLEEPGARLCPTPPVDLATFSALSFHQKDKDFAGQIPSRPRSVKHGRQTMSMSDCGMQPLYPEDPASLNPRAVADAFAQRRLRGSKSKSLTLSPRKATSTKASRRTMSMVSSETPVSGSSGSLRQTKSKHRKHKSFAGHAYSLTSKRLRSLMGHGFFSQKGMYTRASSPLPEAVDTVRAGIGTGQITYEFEE